jgi:hypothetical protein
MAVMFGVAGQLSLQWNKLDKAGVLMEQRPGNLTSMPILTASLINYFGRTLYDNYT